MTLVDIDLRICPFLPLPTDRYRIYISVPGIPMFDTYSIDVNPSDTAFSQLDFFLELARPTVIYIDNPNGIPEGLTVVDELKFFFPIQCTTA
jgi:hypothetical protein